MRKIFKQHHHKKSGNKTNYNKKATRKRYAKILDTGNVISQRYPGVCIKEGDIKYLDLWKRKYTKDNLIFVTDEKHYWPVWFEEGDKQKKTGFNHMKLNKSPKKPSSHVDDLNAVFHVDEKHIPFFLKQVIKNGKVTNVKKRMKKDGTTLDGYDVTFKYEERNVVIGIGDDGYIVTAFPAEDKKTKRRKKK